MNKNVSGGLLGFGFGNGKLPGIHKFVSLRGKW